MGDLSVEPRKQLLAEGKVDAFLGFPPAPQEPRARKIGHVVVNSATDRPWSQYFCCMVVANREFVARHPVATKRAVRAILKADQVCAPSTVGPGERVVKSTMGRIFELWRTFAPRLGTLSTIRMAGSVAITARVSLPSVECVAKNGR